MNAHVDLKSLEKTASVDMVARHMVKQQATSSWLDVVGGCDDCSTVPFDAAAAGRTRTLTQEDGRLMMREAGFGSSVG